MTTNAVRRLLLALLTGCGLILIGVLVPACPAATLAYAQISAEFREALSPYGHWERHPRWGEVWVPDDTPPDWRPYQYGHWVYTNEWGWYWISDSEEEDWGWVTYHYGRWAHDRRLGWFWIPDDEWAPAWVDWRYGDDYVGWAPLPPDELIDAYDDDPAYWVFVAPRFLTAPRLHSYYVPRDRHAFVFRRSHVVNRTLRFDRRRAAVNPGVSPAFVARRTGHALPTYRVSPHVLSGTQGVAGAVRVGPQQLRATGPRGRRPSTTHRHAATVQPTTTTIKAGTTAKAPQPLDKNKRGQLGSHPPRAAQGATPQQLQRTPPQTPQQTAPQSLKQTPAAPPKPSLRKPPALAKPPPPAKIVTPPKPPQGKRVAPAARPAPPIVRQPPPPTVKHATPPPTVKRVTPPQVHKPPPRVTPAARPAPPIVRQPPPPTVKHAMPPPTVKRVAPPQVHKPPPQGKSPARRGAKKPDEQVK